MCKCPNYLLATGRLIYSKDKHVEIPELRFMGHLNHDMTIDKPFVEVPCGKCLECRIQQTRTWADRCVIEAKNWKDNYFVTLTYDDDHLPKNGSLCKRDYQLFIKRLRKHFKGCRYVLSGEYGDLTMRPHYHIIFFNLPLKDLTDKFREAQWSEDGSKVERLVAHVKPESGQYPLYYSKAIHRAWQFKGNISVGRFSYDTAAYISQYCTKKVNPKNKEMYERLGLVPEFLACSTDPGIGKNLFEDIDSAIYDFDKLIIANKDGAHLSSIPRYFDKLFKKKYGDDVFDKMIRVHRVNKKLVNHNNYKHSGRFYDKDCEDRDYRLNKRQKLKTAI